jgi:hypothetical protein
MGCVGVERGLSSGFFFFARTFPAVSLCDGSELRKGSLQVVLTTVRVFASVKERSASPLQHWRPCRVQDGRTHCRTRLLR